LRERLEITVFSALPALRFEFVFKRFFLNSLQSRLCRKSPTRTQMETGWQMKKSH
jgi:hypothetical protein